MGRSRSRGVGWPSRGGRLPSRVGVHAGDAEQSSAPPDRGGGSSARPHRTATASRRGRTPVSGDGGAADRPVAKAPPPERLRSPRRRVRPRRAFFDRARGVTLSFRFRARASVDVRVKLVHGGQVEEELGPAAIRSPTGCTACGGAASYPGPGRPARALPIQAPASRPPGPSVTGVPPLRRHVPGPRAPRIRRPGAAVRRAAQRRPRASGTGRVRLLRHPRGRGPRREGAGSRLGSRPLRQLGGDRRPRHEDRLPVRPLPAPGLRPRRRAGAGPARRIGRVGKTGNARTVGCQLHFEVWPKGWERGRPVDPLPILKRWDRWS